MFQPGTFLLASYAALSQWILICKGALTNDFSYRIVSYRIVSLLNQKKLATCNEFYFWFILVIFIPQLRVNGVEKK